MSSTSFPSSFRVLMVLGLLAALQACTTMSPKECRNANWRDVGMRDGLAGEPLTTLDARSKDCAEANVVIDVPRYLEGRNQGLPDYCRLDNAARVGLSGKPYHGVCAPGIDAEYRRRHAVGLDVYRARADLRGIEHRRRVLEDRLVDARTDEERRRVRDDLRELDYAARRTRDHLRHAEWMLDQLR